MKKTILLSTLFAAAAAVATDVTSGNAVAALNTTVSTSATQKQTLLAVPFEGYEASGTVKVADIVKTSGLADDSKLYVPNKNGGYDTWTLQNGKWTSGVQVTIGSDGTVNASETPSADNLAINRGDAFWLEPKFESDTSGTVFLLGQGNGTSGTSTVAKGWNLVGNASATDKAFEFAGNDYDDIIVQVDGKLRYYTYKSGKGWRYWKADGTLSDPITVAAEKLVISAGQGFWWNHGGTETTINW